MSIIPAYTPWIIAEFHGSCSGCGEGIVPGCEVRADGAGAWAGRCCGTES